MSFLVKPPIATTVKFSSSTGWNGRLSSVVVNVIHQLITIVYEPNKAELVNNYDWMKDFTFLDFARVVGKHITVNYMMA